MINMNKDQWMYNKDKDQKMYNNDMDKDNEMYNKDRDQRRYNQDKGKEMYNMDKDQRMYTDDIDKRKQMYNGDNDQQRYNQDRNQQMYNQDKGQQMNQQQAMLGTVQQCQFTILDLALFLDTHPNDPVALYRHKQYSAYLRKLTEAYENLYGPLNAYSFEKSDTWRYINSPWPWEWSGNREMPRDDKRKRGN